MAYLGRKGASSPLTSSDLPSTATTDVELLAVKQDLTTVALRQAMGDNHVAYNLPNSFIDQFESDSGIGTETDVDRYASEYVGVISDPNTLFLLHGDGSDAGTTFTDSSSNNLSPSSTIGSVTTQTADKKFGTASIDFPSGNAGLVYASNNAFDVNTSTDFTIDWWQKPDAITGLNQIIFHRDINASGDANAGEMYVLSGTDGKLWIGFVNSDYDTGVVCTAGAWMHIALVYDQSASKFYAFQNGVNVKDLSSPTVTTNATGVFSIGSSNGGALYPYAGKIEEFRVSNIARWTSTASFTPPTSAYTTVGATTGTLIGNANVPSTAKTKVSGVMLYKDDAGTATIGTDLEIYFTCNGGTNWTEATYTAVTPLFSTGIKMIRLGETTCTSGSDIRYKGVWANQSASKLTQLHGIGINY
jgi:hypothetical protein